MSNCQKVYEDSTSYRTEIVMSILEDNALNPVMVSKKDTAYQLGHFEVHVAPDNVIKAIRIIKEEIRFE